MSAKKKLVSLIHPPSAPPTASVLVTAVAKTLATWLQQTAIDRARSPLHERFEHLLWSWPIRLGFRTRDPNPWWTPRQDDKATKGLKTTVLARLTSLDEKRIEQRLRARVADVRGLLGKHVPQTRQMLRKLLKDEIVDGRRIPGRIRCMPFSDERGRGYELAATGSDAGLFRMPVVFNDGGGEGGI